MTTGTWNYRVLFYKINLDMSLAIWRMGMQDFSVRGEVYEGRRILWQQYRH